MDKLKKNIYNITKEELKSFLKVKEIPSYRADQIWNWLYVKGVLEFSQMKNLSKSLIDIIDKSFYIEKLKYSKRFISKDGTIKWLFLLKDNREIETVYIPEEKRGTICVSSQVGCTLSCSFCHTGTMKFIRNLDLSEIVQQVLNVKHELNDWHKNTEDRKVSNIVFMGMGEPLFNYDNVLNAITTISDTKGLSLSKRKITLSTSGVVPKIQKFKYETDVNLAISLHAVFDNVRDKLVPINRKWPIAELMKSLKQYSEFKIKKRITIEYIMLKDVNDSIKDAKELIKLIKPLKSKVNLIPFNPWPGSLYEVSSKEKIDIFRKYIYEKGNVIATVRSPRGDDILAACGQLKSIKEQKGKELL